jgi:uncharacterized protein YndB with AHSA1/START domain
MTLNERLDRTIHIDAPPAVVFQYFTDDARWASWWGKGSSIEPTPGGKVYIRHPNAVEIVGEVIEVTPPSKIVFTYGFPAGQPIPAGASRVTIALAPERRGTRLDLRHEFADAAARDMHVQGWRYQLSVFANVVLDALHSNAASTVDAWFAAWGETDAAARRRALDAIAAPDVAFRDRYSLVDGVPDLDAHIAGAQRFMPGVRLTRSGDVRHCQGTVVAPWTAAGPDGAAINSGMNVFTLSGDGKITAATGLWG